MRVSRVQAEENHQKIITEASYLFREYGFDGIGLKDLMRAAGLTQGGFYKQFESKEDLVAQATERALAASTARWARVVGDDTDSLSALAAFYLSAAHRDRRRDGCPLAALSSDAARRTPALREAFEAGIRNHLEFLDARIESDEGEQPSAQALVALSLMVGALTLSRSVNDADLSAAFLASAKEHLGATRIEEISEWVSD